MTTAPGPLPAGLPTDLTAMRVRPTCVTVAGILVIVSGCLGLISVPWNALYLFDLVPMQPQMRDYYQHPGLRQALLMMLPLALIVSPLWIVVGVGLLHLKRWARPMLYVLLGIGTVSHAFVALRGAGAMRSLYATIPHLPPMMIDVLMVASCVVGLVLGLAYVVVLIVLVTRPSANRAFSESGS